MPPFVDALTHAVFDGLPILLAGGRDEYEEEGGKR